MITKNYRQNKEQVLKIYDSYVAFCKENGKDVNNSIRSQAGKIQNEVFNLMVLGEAKSGKSTFINAFLGEEVVPMDVRQCTSSIIEIKRGDSFVLTARTAGGGQSVIRERDKIYAFLKDHAAIADEYRAIPVTTIDSELLIKAKGRDLPKQILMKFIQDEQKDNIYNLDKVEYNRLILKYINENKSKWDKIITKIEITYPLSEDMQGITIIDSPGVGAGGNVGQIAEDYISNANAIIFVKSLTGQALESTSFMNFLRTTCPERQKETLFLILTGIANLSNADCNRLLTQAKELYRSDIQEEKIICADSKVELFANRCRKLGTEENIDKYFDDLDENHADFDPVSKRWLKARGNMDVFYDKIDELSNFKKIRSAIEKFARAANYLQLIEFLKNLEMEYKRIQSNLNDVIKENKETLGDPVALEKRIADKKDELDEIYKKINEGIDEICKKYTDNLMGEGIIQKEAKARQEKYERDIRRFCKCSENDISATTFNEMKKITMDAVDDTKEFRRKIGTQVIQECNEKLIQYTDVASKLPMSSFEPNFTEEDFEQINLGAEKATSGVNKIETGLTFKTTDDRPYHHLKEHVEIVANSICGRLRQDIIPKMTNNVVNYVYSCCDIYRGKLNANKTALENEYKKLLSIRDDNERRREDIQIKEAQLENIDEELKRLTVMKGELQNYVEC